MLYNYIVIVDGCALCDLRRRGYTPASIRSFTDQIGGAALSDRFQFMRQGYFCLDSKDSTADKLVFNRAVGLKDSFKK